MANHIKTNGGIGWRMVGGVVSGVAARTVGSPIDLLKIRFQIQPLDNPHYISIPSAIKEIARKEGVRVVYLYCHLYANYPKSPTAWILGILEGKCSRDLSLCCL